MDYVKLNYSSFMTLLMIFLLRETFFGVSSNFTIDVISLYSRVLETRPNVD